MGIDGSQLVEQPLQLVVLQLIGLLPEPLDGGSRGAVVAFRHEPLRFFVDNPLGFGPLLFPRLAVLVANCLQVVDAVEIDIGEVSDIGVEVTRHGQVEHEQQAFATVAAGCREIVPQSQSVRAIRWC